MPTKAPGKAFRKGLSLIELVAKFPDDITAEKWFEDQRWDEDRENLACPRCGDTNVQRVVKRKPMPYRCRGCRKHFSVRIGSALEASKLGYQKWAIAIFLWTTSLKGISSMKLHRDLGITQKSAYFVAQRLREAWSDLEPLAGPVEVDETFAGGKRKNMPNSKRRELEGRGPKGKTAVVGVRDRKTNKINAKVAKSTSAAELQGFVRDNAASGAEIYTDESPSYKGLASDFQHDSVNHSVSEYVDGQVHTNGIESFWAQLKRGYHGTFHHISEKHLHRYVQEFANRHNSRDKDTEDMMASVFAGLVGKRLMHRELHL